MNLYHRLVEVKNKVKWEMYAWVPSFITYIQSSKKNILLFSSRRGGSTLLAELISSDIDFRYIDQPCDMTDLGIKRAVIQKHLEKPSMSQFLDNSDEHNLKLYYSKLLSGKIPEMGRTSHWPAKRSLLKICNAMGIIPWFQQTFDATMVYLVRHPIPQSLSVIKNKWGITADAYLENPTFRAANLSEEQYQSGKKILREGSDLEKAVLNWVLENMAPLKLVHTNTLILVTYEELILNSEKIIELLCEKLELKNKDYMKQLLRKPSSSRTFSDPITNNAIANNEKEFLINKWEQKVHADEKKKIQNILTKFGIEIYNINSPYPDKKFVYSIFHQQK